LGVFLNETAPKPGRVRVPHSAKRRIYALDLEVWLHRSVMVYRYAGSLGNIDGNHDVVPSAPARTRGVFIVRKVFQERYEASFQRKYLRIS